MANYLKLPITNSRKQYEKCRVNDVLLFSDELTNWYNFYIKNTDKWSVDAVDEIEDKDGEPYIFPQCLTDMDFYYHEAIRGKLASIIKMFSREQFIDAVNSGYSPSALYKMYLDISNLEQYFDYILPDLRKQPVNEIRYISQNSEQLTEIADAFFTDRSPAIWSNMNNVKTLIDIPEQYIPFIKEAANNHVPLETIVEYADNIDVFYNAWCEDDIPIADVFA